MSVLFITPDYASHYLPLIAVGKAWQAIGEEVIVATGTALADRIQANGFRHVHLELSSGSNPGLVRTEDFARLTANIDATRHGILHILRFQAQSRLRSLLWKPIEVAERINQILTEERPRFVVSVQLSYNATAALLALRAPFATLVTGHPTEFPALDELYGYPYSRPARFIVSEDDLRDLAALCQEVQQRFTDVFNQTLRQIDSGVKPVVNGLAAASPNLIMLNYPKEMKGDRLSVLPDHTHFVGSLVRDEVLDPELEEWLQSMRPDLPTVYVTLGSVLTLRMDVLALIINALRSEELRVLVASGVADPSVWGDLPDHWMVRPYYPQIALLRHTDLVICHGGNNTITEALTAGVPLLVGPLSADQFGGAADIERYRLGEVFDPNASSPTEIRQLAYKALAVSSNAALLGRQLRAHPGASQAFKLCQEIFHCV